MTITEVLLIVIFAFLMVLNIFYRHERELAEAVAELNEIGPIATELRNAVQELGSGAPQMESMDVNAGPLSELVTVRDSLETISDVASFDEPDLWEVVRRYGGLERIVQALHETEQAAQLAREESAILLNAIQSAGIEVPDSFYSGLGDEPGNCWYSDPVERTGDQYLLHVTILEDRLYVRSAWPPERERELQAIAAAEPLFTSLPQAMTYQGFMSWAKGIFEYSKTQNCRFFVRAFDKAVTKEGFQNGLRAIEERFYKLAENF